MIEDKALKALERWERFYMHIGTCRCCRKGHPCLDRDELYIAAVWLNRSALVTIRRARVWARIAC